MKSERWWTTTRAIAYFDLADAAAAGLTPARMVETARQIGADVVGLRAAGPSAWYRSALAHQPSALAADGPDRLARLVEIAHDQGLRVIVVKVRDPNNPGCATIGFEPDDFVCDDQGHIERRNLSVKNSTTELYYTLAGVF